MFFLAPPLTVRAQIISNESAFISIASGILTADSIHNYSTGSIANDGTITTYSIYNAGNIHGNGVYNISDSFGNIGSFSADTSTFNYASSGDQTITAVNYYNLTIASTAGRQITLSPSGTIGISNQLSLAGMPATYEADGSTLDFNGTHTQTIPSFAFNNLTIDNVSGATLSSASTLKGILKVNGQFNSAGNLTMLSTAGQTALIDGSGTGNVLGDVTMQCYLSVGFGYKYISSPFSDATVNELSDDLNLNASFPAFYSYDEDRLSSGWVTDTISANQLEPLAGYAANFGSSTADKTIDITGNPNNGSLTVTLYNHNRPFTQGFNLIGNPYPSPIDWDAPGGWSRTNIDNSIYYFNSSDTNQYTGVYSSYVNGISSDGIASNIVPAMQGFFVHVSNGSFPVTGTLTLNNSARVNNLLSVFHKPAGSAVPLLRLSATDNVYPQIIDYLVAYLDDSATTIYSKERDALKLFNTDPHAPNLYALSSDAFKLSIKSIPDSIDSLTLIPLGLALNNAGTITFQVVSFESITDNIHIYFLDQLTGKSEELHSGIKFELYLNSGEYSNRFFLVFSAKFPLGNVSTAPQMVVHSFGNRVVVYSPEINSQLILSDPLGRIVLRENLDDSGYHEITTSLSTGIYIATLYFNKQKQSKKLFIEEE